MSRPAVAGPAMLSEPLSHPSALDRAARGDRSRVGRPAWRGAGARGGSSCRAFLSREGPRSCLALVQAEHHLPYVVVFRNDEGDLSVALTWCLDVLTDQDMGLRERAAASPAWRIARPSQWHGEPAARAAELCVVWAVFVIRGETLLHAADVCKGEYSLHEPSPGVGLRTAGCVFA